MMWHEARKQEKKIRCMLVDYQRRAQRRKDYYDRIKADPTQFLQLHGRPCKIHLDPAICIAANSSATMMPWQGNASIMIDRFDVRAHLDYIPDISTNTKTENDLSYEERQINYERYRILVQNDFFNIAEDKFLHQINLEEKFGPLLKNVEETNSNKRKATAAIAYNYDDEENFQSTLSNSGMKSDDVGRINTLSSQTLNVDINDENDSESDIDLDLTVDVSKIETQQANELNSCAHPYGMLTNDFFSFLNNDLEEAENMRIVKEQEEEKAMFSGRKSRKERRAFRERTLIGRKLSPPSYAWRKSPSYEDYKALVSSNRSRSKSSSPVNSGKITYITSFGGEEPTTSTNVVTNRSHSRGKEYSKRSKRSRSGSGEFKRKLSAQKIFSSKSRSRSRSKSELDNKCKVKSQELNSKFDKGCRRQSLSRSRSHSEHRTSHESLRNIFDSIPSSSGSNVGISSEQITIPRYYGRRKNDSSSELSLSSNEESSKQSETPKNKTNQIPASVRLSTASIKNTSSDSKITPQERLRRKRQVLLNKQFKADKRAEREKVLKMVQERIDRAEEMKEISIKLRRRQRMLRHNDSPRRHSSRSRSSSWDDRSPSRSPYSRRHSKRSDKYRSKSPSTDDSEDSTRKERRRNYKKYKNSDSHSRSRSRSRSPRKSRYTDEYDSRKSNTKEREKDLRFRRYCTLSEEKELARVQLESKTDKLDGRGDSRNEYRSRRDRSPKYKFSTSECVGERREKTYESDRYRNTRSRFSRRSSSHDRQSSRI